MDKLAGETGNPEPSWVFTLCEAKNCLESLLDELARITTDRRSALDEDNSLLAECFRAPVQDITAEMAALAPWFGCRFRRPGALTTTGQKPASGPTFLLCRN